MHKFFFFYVLIAVALVPAGAEAADWTAVKLRGLVLANNVAGDGPWVRLKRGDIVDDARVIRTLGNGNVEFQSGAETIALGPGTQAEIVDRGGRRFTTVAEQVGTVAVSAEALAVQHFSVETPYLVAVVKGTVFSVMTGSTGSDVSVSRGLVAVVDRRGRRQVLLPAGRSMAVTADGRTLVSGDAIPALVHPRVNGVIEDADAATGEGAVTAQGAGSVAGSGPAISNVDADLGANASGLVQTTGAIGTTLGTAIGGIGPTVVGLGQTTGAVGTTLGSTVGTLGSNVGLGAVTGSVGSALGTATATVGNTVSSVGGAVTSLGTTVNAATTTSGTALGSVTRSVAGTVGGALSHLGL
jgi:hypothetical protein